MSKKIFIAWLALALVGCNSKTIQVVPLQNQVDGKVAVYYTLPRTVIYIRVICIQNEYIPGPYADYATKFLGIEGVSNTPKIEYSIEKVDIEAQSESDPKAMFAVYPSGKGYGNFLALSQEGLILPVNKNINGKSIYLEQERSDLDGIVYKDLSPNPFIAQENSTFYGRTLRDSVYVRVPIQRSVTVEKNMEEKAQEAADFIFNIRKKRLDFLTPDIDHPFTGDALQLILNELQRLEDEYLALFIGKRFAHKITQIFSYIPSNLEGESAILFRFSESKGILPATDLSGRPIIVELDQPEYPEALDAVKSSIETLTSKANLDRFYYRISFGTNIRIADGKQQLIAKRLNVYQYGVLAQLPVNFPEKNN